MAETIRAHKTSRAHVKSVVSTAFNHIRDTIAKTATSADISMAVQLAREAIEDALQADWKNADDIGVLLSEGYARTHAILDQRTLHMDPYYGAGEETVDGILITDPCGTLVVFADQSTTAPAELSLLHAQTIDTVIPAKETRRGRPKRAPED